MATRLRKGSAGSGKGAASLLREALATVRAMGITAQIIVRADSAYFSHKVVQVCRTAGARFSLAVAVRKKIREAIAGIAEDAWTPIRYAAAVWDDEEERWMHQRGLLVRRGRPADDPAGEGIHDERDIDGAGPGGHIGEVRDPDPVRGAGHELPAQPVRGPLRFLSVTVVTIFFPRTAPVRPSAFIRRSTVQRATRWPRRFNSAQILRAP